uniref:Protein kinase domain-containing protein n=1 Tax=Panagrolaimus sp. PS1159 TaxID=55785 RepID=A0AC35GQZ1_9BILA
MSEEDDLESLGVKSGAVLQSGKTKYVIIKLLGEGGFGAVFLVQDMVSRERERPSFALKVEKKLDHRRHSKLKMEIAILKAVGTIKHNEQQQKKDKPERFLRHFTEIIDRAKKDRYFFLVMQLVGKSLADLKYERRERVLSLGTGLSVSHQCLEAVQCLHEVGYLHRDLKPANYACGLKDKSHNIYILDFGIARMYKKKNDLGLMEIKTPRDSVLFKGTVRFASLACHRNVEMGPKDDCESWFYLLIDLLVPKGLPWRRENDKIIVQKIKETARKSPEMLFNKIKCEEELTKVFTYLNNLEYTDSVDYEYIYQLLEEAGKTCAVDLSAPYEWEIQTTTTHAPISGAPGQESIKK